MASSNNNSKQSPMKLFVFMSSLLFATTTTTSAFQTVDPTPSHLKRASIPTRTSKLHYTYADIPEAATTPAFNSKVRNILQDTVKPKTTKKNKGLSNLRTVNSKDELRSAVLEDEDRLTVVRFHAPYCQACKRMEPLMHKFAKRNPDIQFIDVPYTKDKSNRQLVHSLGVPTFPYMHVYHPASLGLLEEHSVNQKYWKDFSSIIESYQDGGCDVSPYPDEDGLYSTPYKSLNEPVEVTAVPTSR